MLPRVLQLVSHVIKNSGNLFKKVSYGAPESGWPSSDSSWKSYYMLGTATKLSMPFQVLKEMFFLGLGLAVTEIDIKSTETRLKNVKRCRDGMPKSMQTR